MTPKVTTGGYEKLVKSLQAHAATQEVKRETGGQVRWYRPPGWSGDPADYDAMSAPFAREGLNQGMIDAQKDADNPGGDGEIVAASQMIAHAAVFERAFRVRHTLRRRRGTALQAGRYRGHGSDSGPHVTLGIEPIREALAAAATEAA